MRTGGNVFVRENTIFILFSPRRDHRLWPPGFWIPFIPTQTSGAPQVLIKIVYRSIYLYTWKNANYTSVFQKHLSDIHTSTHPYGDVVFKLLRLRTSQARGEGHDGQSLASGNDETREGRWTFLNIYLSVFQYSLGMMPLVSQIPQLHISIQQTLVCLMSTLLLTNTVVSV